MKTYEQVKDRIQELKAHKEFFQKEIDKLKYLGRYNEADKMYQSEIVITNQIISYLRWILE